jgi:hypothetical protein
MRNQNSGNKKCRLDGMNTSQNRTECLDDFGNKWACKIVDISERGLGSIMRAAFCRGDIVYIADPKTKARVVWVEKKQDRTSGLLLGRL